MNKKLNLINNTNHKHSTCYEAHEHYKVQCNKMHCKYWIKKLDSCNCTLLAAKTPMTLHDIGIIFGLTRMRICQIEKTAKAKLFGLLKRNNKKLF